MKPDRQLPDIYFSDKFPFAPVFLPEAEVQAMIEDRLPSYERASALIEAYLQNASWLIRPADREQIWEELMPEVYKKGRFGNRNASGSAQLIHPHTLSLLLAIFAVGAIADLTLPPWNEEAELYYQLSRVAISLKPVFDGAGLTAVQAIALLVMYDVFACRKSTFDGTWKMTSFCMALAGSVRIYLLSMSKPVY